MKSAEGVSLPFELDRRLKQRIEHLRDVRESLEKLGRSAGSLQRMFAAEQERSRARAAAEAAPAAPAVKEAKGRTPPPPPARTPPPPPPSSAPAKLAEEEEEIPAWRKLFPDLSAEVPGRKK